MTEYVVHFATTASTSERVTADDPEEAVDKAWSEVYVSLCHQCGRECDLTGEWEPVAVTDLATGELVWEEKT